MANVKDAIRMPTKRGGNSSTATTPQSKQIGLQRPNTIEDDLPLPPQDLSSVEQPNLDAYFMPLPPPEAASIYSVYKATLSGQLSQLTQTDLPDAACLAAAITALPTAPAAVKALTNSAEQIKSWIRSAAEVLGGLDAEDDVDWAGSGSRDGVVDVETAIQKFEKLVSTYVTAVEDARKRADVQSVPKAEMTTFLDTLEEVISAWEKVKEALQKVKTQNELAMEWEDIWNVTLGEIGQEIDALSTLVFELEERRYTGGFDDETAIEHATPSVDIKELETIVEESPSLKGIRGVRDVSLSWASPSASPGLQGPSEDSRLLALFARMQPLRASLDFLPMQLTTYEARAIKTFPSACLELQSRRCTLEQKYKILEVDAETLRRELGEDRWVIVFRTAARQARKMCESVEKGMQKLQDTLRDDTKASNAGLLAKRISDYEAKRNNYGPAIQKVLSMIDKGVKDRVTVNGEILRIHEDMHQMWTELEKRLHEIDGSLDEAQAIRSQQLRDSISTIMSTDMSGIISNTETPASSLASSPAVGPADNASIPSTPDMSLPRSRNSSVRSLSSSRPSISRRVASQPPSSSIRHQTIHLLPISRLSTASPCPASRSNTTPMPTIPSSRTVTPGTATGPPKPRWSVGSAIDRKLLETKSSFTPTAYARRLKESRPSVYSLRSASGSAVSSTLPSPSPFGSSNLSSSRYSAGHIMARAASSLGIRSHRDSSPTPSFGAGSITDSVDGDIPVGRPRSRLYRPSLSTNGRDTPSSTRVPSLSSKTAGIVRRTSMLPLPLLNTSPPLPALTGDESHSSRADPDHLDDYNILPSIEHDEISSLTPTVSTKQRLPLRPASSLGRASASFHGGPVVTQTRASLLRAGSAASGAGSTKGKPKWK